MDAHVLRRQITGLFLDDAQAAAVGQQHQVLQMVRQFLEPANTPAVNAMPTSKPRKRKQHFSSGLMGYPPHKAMHPLLLQAQHNTASW